MEATRRTFFQAGAALTAAGFHQTLYDTLQKKIPMAKRPEPMADVP